MLLRRTCWLTLPNYMELDTNILLIAPVSTGSVLVNTAAREKKNMAQLLARCCTGCVFNSDPQARRDPRPADGRAAPGGRLTGSRQPKTHPHGASQPVAVVACAAAAGWPVSARPYKGLIALASRPRALCHTDCNKGCDVLHGGQKENIFTA